jgi:hypothetical protein
MRNFIFAGCILALILMLLAPGITFAQSVANANIHGVVSDASGAVIAGAKIKATQTSMGQVRETSSASDGSYALPNLPVGPYSLEVTATSFTTYMQTGIDLHVADNVLVNATLEVGAVTQELRVSANASMVATQETSISEVVDQRRIVDLPLNGRQATDLIILSGGSNVPPTVASGSRTIASTHDYVSASPVSISGGQENGNNYLLDGGDNNDSHSNVNMPFPFPDALQEFSVQTNGVSARYGLHPYAVINAVTKSGTNQIHGSLFEFVRNGDLNARNFFAAAQDTLRRNQFGGTVGGRIIKDKLFLFNGFQTTRTRTAPPQTISYVNTQASLNGDFSMLDSAACQSSHKAISLVDPNNGNTPFPNDQIPVSRFSAPSLALAKLVPVSTDPCGQIIYAIPNPNNENQYVGRVDWLQSSKNTVYGRYFISDYDNPPIYTNNILTTTRAGMEERSQSVTVADQYSGQSFVNAFHATFARLFTNRIVSPTTPNVAELGSNITQFYPHFVNVTVSNYFSIGGGSNAPATFGRNQFQYADDVDLIRGSHHIMFGVEEMALQMYVENIGNANGSWSFNGSLSKDALADFMLGRPNQLQDGNPNAAGLRQKYWGVYGQDDIQVTKGLNIHVGLRWEPSLPEYDVNGRGQYFSMSAFRAGQVSTVHPNAPAGLLYYGDPGIPAAYANSSYLGFAPRVGFAWDPTAKGTQSWRGSYGVFFDTPESYMQGDWGKAAPWASTIVLTAPVGGFANPFQGYPGGNPFPAPPPSKNSIYPSAGQYISNPLNLHHMYEQQWDLSYQRQFGGDWLVSASYVGSKANHLRTANEQNPSVYIPGASTVSNTATRRVLYLLNPIMGAYYSQITTMDDGMTSDYHALRLSAQHRFSHNFTVLSVYTWSHCMQNAEPIANRNAAGANYYQNPYNRDADVAACDFDMRQNLVASLVYQAPKFTNRALDEVLGHWQLGTLGSVHTGFAFNPITGVDNSLTGVGQDRPNVVGNAYVKNLSTLVWITPTAFVANPLGTFGNAGYNSLRGPGFFDMDANLSRVFRVRERSQFQLRFEFFNFLNHTNFSPPVSALNSSSFGEIQASADPRILQFALKFTF